MLALVLALVGGCEGARVSLQLQTGPDGDPPADASQLQTLTVLIDNGTVEDRESFELNREDQVVLPPLAVDKTDPFLIEVWGCESATCEEADVALRGCTPTPIDARDATETIVVTVLMYDVNDDVLRQCPTLP